MNPGILTPDEPEDFSVLATTEDPPPTPHVLSVHDSLVDEGDGGDDLHDLSTPSISLGDWVSGAANPTGSSPAMSLSAFSGMSDAAALHHPSSEGAGPRKGIKKLLSTFKKKPGHA
jgi:hypothetical protein